MSTDPLGGVVEQWTAIGSIAILLSNERTTPPFAQEPKPTMETTAEVLDPTINCAIVKLSTRAFPGVLLQGDTLHSLYSRVQKTLATLNPDEQPEAYDELEFVVDSLKGYLDLYESVLTRHGHSLPYF